MKIGRRMHAYNIDEVDEQRKRQETALSLLLVLLIAGIIVLVLSGGPMPS